MAIPTLDVDCALGKDMVRKGAVFVRTQVATDSQLKQHFLKQTMRFASVLGTAMESQAPHRDFSTDLGLFTQKGEGLLPFIWPPEKKNP